MAGEVIQHLLIVVNNKSIGKTLQQLESDNPSIPKKKKIDGSANHNKKPITAEKEPKTKAKLLAEKHPRTKIPDSGMHPKNIIVGSPSYIPYKKITKNQMGKGKFGKKLKFPVSSSSKMP